MKEMFYLQTYSTHFIYGYMVIWHQTYGKGPFRQRERKPVVATIWDTVSYWQQGIFYMHYPRQDNTYHSLYYTSHGAKEKKEMFYLMTQHILFTVIWGQTYGNELR